MLMAPCSLPPRQFTNDFVRLALFWMMYSVLDKLQGDIGSWSDVIGARVY